MEESHILHGKKCPTLDFFISSDRSVSSGIFTPLGSQLQPSLRSCVKTTLGGVKTPSETLLPEEKKKSSVVPFSHGGKRHFYYSTFMLWKEKFREKRDEISRKNNFSSLVSRILHETRKEKHYSQKSKKISIFLL